MRSCAAWSIHAAHFPFMFYSRLLAVPQMKQGFRECAALFLSQQRQRKKMQMSWTVFLLLGGISIAGNPEVDFRDESSARKNYDPGRNAISTWANGMTTRGTTTTTITETSRTTWENIYTGWKETESSWIVNVVSRSGTVVALPVGGWNEKETFTYYGAYYKVLKGRLVTVRVKICAPNATKPPNERQCRQTVKNLAEAGISIPRSAGRGGHLQPLKRLAKNRYGAQNVMVIYDGCEDNELKFVLFGCDDKKANPYIRTMMFDGEIPCADAKNPVEENHSDNSKPDNSRKVIINRLSDKGDGIIYNDKVQR